MKKIFMTLVAVCFAATMNAQVYVGGSLGFNAWSSQENAGDRSETTFRFLGYRYRYRLREQQVDWCKWC